MLGDRLPATPKRSTDYATFAQKGLFVSVQHGMVHANKRDLQDILSKDQNARVITAGDFNEVCNIDV
jgi:hypothetical protein